MRAVVLHARGDLRVEEVDDPVVGSGGVLVEMEWGGICGSDVAYWRTGVSGTAVLAEPLVLGHEVSGRVREIGPEAVVPLSERGVRVGTAVTVHPATPVGEHEVVPEVRERTNLWPQVRYLGSAAFRPHEQGAFSRLRTVRPDQLRVLPPGVSTKEGAVAEPFGVALHAVARAGDVAGRRVLVNGCGPVGALVVAAARAAGAAHVVAVDVSDAALAVAGRMGADELVNPRRGGDLPRDVDVAVEASGVPAVLRGLLAAVRRGGVLVQVGNLPTTEVPVSLGDLVTREIDYRGSYRFVDEISRALELMAAGVDVSPLLTHEVPLDDVVRGFELAADRSTGSSKVMIRLQS